MNLFQIILDRVLSCREFPRIRPSERSLLHEGSEHQGDHGKSHPQEERWCHNVFQTVFLEPLVQFWPDTIVFLFVILTQFSVQMRLYLSRFSYVIVIIRIVRLGVQLRIIYIFVWRWMINLGEPSVGVFVWDGRVADDRWTTMKSRWLRVDHFNGWAFLLERYRYTGNFIAKLITYRLEWTFILISSSENNQLLHWIRKFSQIL